MSTIANAVQAMVNNLTEKMTSGTPFNPEEQLLIAKALSALQDNETWEKAVVAVVEEHLDTGTTALAAAKDQLDASTLAGVNAMTTAEASLLAKAAQLDIAASVPDSLRRYVQTKDGLIGDLDNLLTIIPDADVIDDAAYSTYAPLVDTFFCSNGDVYAHAVANASLAGTTHAALRYSHNFYSKAAALDAKVGVFTRFNYCHASTDTLRTLWNQRYSFYPAMGLFPLASKANADAIDFTMVIDEFNGTNANAANYRGLGLFYNQTYATVNGHYNNASITDKYGRNATALVSGYRNPGYDSCALYDNVKNCLVVIQDGKVWELYSDGWHDPAVPVFGTAQQAQDWVNAQPDLFVVPIRSSGEPRVYTPMAKDFYGAGRTAAMSGSLSEAVRGIMGRMANPIIAGATSQLGLYGSIDTKYMLTHIGYSDAHNLGMNGSYSASQQYLWDVATKTLVPTIREDILESIPKQFTGTGSTSNFFTTFKQRSIVKRLDTLEVLGDAYRIHQAASSYGVQTADVMMYNPFDDTWYQALAVNLYSDTTEYYSGFVRLQKLSEAVAQLLGRQV